MWKQRGEEYRVTGGNGWLWVSSVRIYSYVPQDTVGLRSVAAKIRARRRKGLRQKSTANDSKSAMTGQQSDNKEESMECEETSANKNMELETSAEKTEKPMEKMEVDPVKSEDEPNNSGQSQSGSVEAKDSSEKMDSEECSEEAKSVISGQVSSKEDEMKAPAATDEVSESVVPKENMSITNKSTEAEEKSLKDDVKQEPADNYQEVKEKRDDDFMYHLPPKVEEDLIDVSNALLERTHYAKVTKPYSRLDNLLERRQKQDEWEKKQRQALEQQIQWKLKYQNNQKVELEKASKEKKDEKNIKQEEGEEETKVKQEKDVSVKEEVEVKVEPEGAKGQEDIKKEDEENDVEKETKKEEAEQKAGIAKVKDEELENKVAGSTDKSQVNDEEKEVDEKRNTVEDMEVEESAKFEYMCYSVVCRQGGKSKCYSPMCIVSCKIEPGLLDEVTSANKKKSAASGEDQKCSSTELLDDSTKLNTEDEEVDVEGDKDLKSNASASANLLSTLRAASSSDENSNDSYFRDDSKSKESKESISNTDDKSSTDEKDESKDGTCDAKNLPFSSLPIPDPSSVAQLLATRAGVSLSQAQMALQQAIAKMSIKDLNAKLPPLRKTSDKFKLAKFTRIAPGRRGKGVAGRGKSSLPVCQKFRTSQRKKNIFILEKHEVYKLARKQGHKEASGFNYNCKMNNVNWPYPCARPVFRSCWRYRTQTLKTLAAAASQFRQLWACLRWDDMSIKSPAGGTNTVSTETEITTTELLKRRDVGPFNLRSEFLVRKIVVPIGVSAQPKGN